MARRKEILPNIVRKDIDKIIENYDLEIDEIKRIFVERAEEAQKNKYDDSAKVESVLNRAMTLENTRMALDAKHRKSRADRIAEKQESERRKAEHEAELKRIRTEFLEKETSRIESEVRAKFEAIAEERDLERQIAEEKAAEEREAERAAREAERLAQEEADAEARVAARLAEEERAANEREQARFDKELAEETAFEEEMRRKAEFLKAARKAALDGTLDGKKKVYRAVRRKPKGD